MTAGRPSVASSIISRRYPRLVGGTVLPWNTFQLRISVGTSHPVIVG
jgi:hypothetical protein